MTLLTPDDEAWIRGAQQQSERARLTWEADSSALARKYGRRWIALFDGKVIADDRTPESLRAKLDGLGEPGRAAVLRFVPPEDWEFAF